MRLAKLIKVVKLRFDEEKKSENIFVKNYIPRRLFTEAEDKNTKTRDDKTSSAIENKVVLDQRFE